MKRLCALFLLFGVSAVKYNGDPTVMTKAFTPSLEVAEKVYHQAQDELQKSDEEFQMTSKNINRA